jgi:hypothetical protein
MLVHEINVLWVPTLASVSAVTEAFPFRSFTILPPVSDRRLDLLFLFPRANFCCRCFSSRFRRSISSSALTSISSFSPQDQPRISFPHEIHPSHGYHRWHRFSCFSSAAVLGADKSAQGSAFLLSSFFPLLRVRYSAHADYQGAAREVDDDYGSSTCNPKLHRTFVDYFLGLWLLSHGSHHLGLVLSRRRQFLPQFGGFLCRAWEVLNGMRMR